MTSAPRSASSIGPNGPARYCPKSTTRMPSSGPAMSDDTSRPQLGELGVVMTDRPEDLVGVGTGRRLRTTHRARCLGEEHRDTDLRRRSDVGVVDLDDGAGRSQ